LFFYDYYSIALWRVLGFLTTDESIKIGKAIIGVPAKPVNPFCNSSQSDETVFSIIDAWRK